MSSERHITLAKPPRIFLLIRRLVRQTPNAKFQAGYWSLGKGCSKRGDWKTAVRAQFVVTSLADAVANCMADATSLHAPQRAEL